jgi:hypothetical protein
MKYTVVWTGRAERYLTEAWLQSRLRHTIRSAAVEIDNALQSDPHTCGESRDEGRRVMYVLPLGALFKIDEHRHEVRVLSVWKI